MKPLQFPRPDAAAAPAASPESKVRILLVDDQAANLLALESLLADGQYELVKARSGTEGLRLLLQEEFALVLLDVLMPGMDGFETAALIRERKQTRDTPIIFITASNSNENHVTRGYSLGAVDYIYKPIVPEILKAKVSVFAELHRKTQRLKSSERALRRELEEHGKTAALRRESEDKYRELFGRATESIVVYDPDTGAIVDANDAAVELYGYTREELLRLKKRDLVEGEEGLPPARGAKFSRGRVQARHRTKGGRVFRAEVTRAALCLAGRELVMTLTRDLTEREQAEEGERLRQREAMQRQMIATVSHELRTPIAAIKASAETLRAGTAAGGPKDRARFLEIIENHADRLSAIVENLLIDAEIESGKIQPNPGLIALKPFAETLVRAMTPLAERRMVTLILRAEEGVALWIDPEHLSRILHNLIDNAIKYSRKNGLVEVRATRAGPGEARISVIDAGIGIDAADLPLIFQQFFRSDKARALSIKGTGLGLSILKTLVEANGGRIWAESEKGKGSAFHFTAPAGKPKARLKAAA